VIRFAHRHADAGGISGFAPHWDRHPAPIGNLLGLAILPLTPRDAKV
jgi:hypothetical protein